MITFEEHKIAIVGFGQTDAACQLWGMCTYKNDTNMMLHLVQLVGLSKSKQNIAFCEQARTMTLF